MREKWFSKSDLAQSNSAVLDESKCIKAMQWSPHFISAGMAVSWPDNNNGILTKQTRAGDRDPPHN